MGIRYYHRSGRGRGYSNGPFLEMLQTRGFWLTIGVLWLIGMVIGLANGDHNSQQTMIGILGWGAIFVVAIAGWRWLKGAAAPTKPAGPATAKPAAAPARTKKTCPDCAESVLAAANVCKHCGYRFD